MPLAGQHAQRRGGVVARLANAAHRGRDQAGDGMLRMAQQPGPAHFAQRLEPDQRARRRRRQLDRAKRHRQRQPLGGRAAHRAQHAGQYPQAEPGCHISVVVGCALRGHHIEQRQCQFLGQQGRHHGIERAPAGELAQGLPGGEQRLHIALANRQHGLFEQAGLFAACVAEPQVARQQLHIAGLGLVVATHLPVAHRRPFLALALGPALDRGKIQRRERKRAGGGNALLAKPGRIGQHRGQVLNGGRLGRLRQPGLQLPHQVALGRAQPRQHALGPGGMRLQQRGQAGRVQAGILATGKRQAGQGPKRRQRPAGGSLLEARHGGLAVGRHPRQRGNGVGQADGRQAFASLFDGRAWRQDG
ncbi:hypothetical protein [Cupriavidus basilensis]|uniref:hypothetical protein n=1 Tax=Cupriavidus basilensis TaxID=68895 RepID=UPI0039F68C00